MASRAAPAMPVARKAATLSPCQVNKSSRTSSATFVSKFTTPSSAIAIPARARATPPRRTALGLGDDPAAHFLAHGRVALSRGLDFGANGAGFVRHSRHSRRLSRVQYARAVPTCGERAGVAGDASRPAWFPRLGL